MAFSDELTAAGFQVFKSNEPATLLTNRYFLVGSKEVFMARAKAIGRTVIDFANTGTVLLDMSHVDYKNIYFFPDGGITIAVQIIED